MAVAHLAFEFGFRDEGGDTVDHHHVDRARAHQRVGDLEGLFAGIGLGDQKLVDIDAQLSGVAGIEGVFRVDEGADPAFLLGFGNAVKRERGLARAFRPVDLDDPAFGQAADAKGQIKAEGSGGNRLDINGRAPGAQLHHRAFAEGAFDLPDRGVQRLLPIACGTRTVGRQLSHDHHPCCLPSCTMLPSVIAVEERQRKGCFR